MAAVLAMSAPWSPTGETQPSTTSSTRPGSSFSLRTSVSCMRPTTRSTGLVPCSDPLNLPFPRGVRTASKTRASVAGIGVRPPVFTARRAPARLPSGRERLVQGLDLLWTGYASPLYQAALDLWSHARTAPELRERLAPVERDLDRQTLQVTRRLFGELAAQPDFDRLIELAAA